MQADQGSSELYVSSVVTPQLWDTVVAPTLIELECMQKDPQRKGEKPGSLIATIHSFDKNEDYQAMIETANIFDFLAVDKVLHYKCFYTISCWYSQYAYFFNYPEYARYYARYIEEQLNPGLAEQICNTCYPKNARKTIIRTPKQQEVYPWRRAIVIYGTLFSTVCLAFRSLYGHWMPKEL